jgi:hypothetical protein
MTQHALLDEINAPTTDSFSPCLSPPEVDQRGAGRILSVSPPEFKQLVQESRRRIQAMSPLRFHLKQWLLRFVGALIRMENRL